MWGQVRTEERPGNVEGVECEGKGLTGNLGAAEDGRSGDSGTPQGKAPTAAG